MTGYGKATVEHKGKKIVVEIKSLNGKTIDLAMHVATTYRSHEMHLRRYLTERLVRGKVDFSIHTEATTIDTPLNDKVIEAYYKQIKTLCERTSIPEPTDWLALLVRLPDATAYAETDEPTDDEWQAAQQAVEAAVDALDDYRTQEGKTLEATLRTKIRNITALLHSLEPHEQARVEKIRARIIDALKTIPEADYDANRLEQELIYYIEKLDISEEKQRLANHLDYFAKTLDEGGAQGKKLGFIAQEMGREINTTGSKSNNAEMQNIVVKMKDELEQIKEQVLNAL